MNSNGAKKLLLAATVASAIGVSGSSVLAQSINTIETTVATGTAGTSITTDPIITAILSSPGTVDGKTYSSWSFLVNDGTGSMDIFGTLPSGSTYVPTVGDSIALTGKYSPYEQLPEIENLTSISLVSSGNSVAPIGLSNIPTLNQATLPFSVAGYEWTVDNFTISGLTTLGTANQTGEIMDGDGNSMQLYYWESSYSSALANLDGFTPVAGQEYDVTGFDTVYSGTAQFVATSIIAVPEPTTLALAGLGGLSVLFLRRRRA
jgi:hypothetical protein